MKRSTPAAISPASAQAARAWFVRVLRVMVVFLLIFDQISSPLHDHHHDAGPDGVTQQLLLSVEHALGAHMEQSDELTAIHAVTAIKREARYSPVLQDADELPVAIIPTLFTVLLGANDVLPRSWPGETRQFIVTYRSLPPGGRAPPLHT